MLKIEGKKCLGGVGGGEAAGWNEGKIESVERFVQTWRIEDVMADWYEKERGSWLSCMGKNWFGYGTGKEMEEQKQESQLMPLCSWGKTGSWILILPYLHCFPCPPTGAFSLCLISYLWDIVKLIISRFWNSVEMWKICQDLQGLSFNQTEQDLAAKKQAQ